MTSPTAPCPLSPVPCPLSTVPCPLSTVHWYAVHTKPRQETLAKTSLDREGIETFYPKLKRRRTIRRVRKWVTGPLFPCYIFARFDHVKSGRLVKYANGVTNIVSFGGKPAIVDDALLAQIRAHCQVSDSSLIPHPSSLDTVLLEPVSFKPGDRVEIQTGPMQGLQGVFEREMSDRDRVIILLDTLAQGARVQLTRDQLEKIA